MQCREQDLFWQKRRGAAPALLFCFSCEQRYVWNNNAWSDSVPVSNFSNISPLSLFQMAPANSSSHSHLSNSSAPPQLHPWTTNRKKTHRQTAAGPVPYNLRFPALAGCQKLDRVQQDLATTPKLIPHETQRGPNERKVEPPTPSDLLLLLMANTSQAPSYHTDTANLTPSRGQPSSHERTSATRNDAS